jgi:hypothetical protein
MPSKTSFKPSTMPRGLRWKFENRDNFNHVELSVICLPGFSYGGDEGLFEILCSWEEDVKGGLSFAEVALYIEKFNELSAAADASQPVKKT